MERNQKSLSSLEKRKRVRETLEFLKYDGQLIIEPQWNSWNHEEEKEKEKQK
ncbi:MAG: hypothetical protein JSV04_06395 [Candidatus Heimdallarchaeota archaeon]|nr:MAG: hypothetical protein JSV04_06395 [Candidatus Heimdallarchaeota archaeon]